MQDYLRSLLTSYSLYTHNYATTWQCVQFVLYIYLVPPVPARRSTQPVSSGRPSMTVPHNVHTMPMVYPTSTASGSSEPSLSGSRSPPERSYSTSTSYLFDDTAISPGPTSPDPPRSILKNSQSTTKKDQSCAIQ